jgi:1-acyl-sn-glycerol-3-phosphate acyltransferase
MKHWNTCTRILSRPPKSMRIVRLVVSRAMRRIFRVRIRGIENVPIGNYILLANHLSWIDAFLLFIALPIEPRIYFLAAEQGFNHRWKRWGIKLFDCAILFERGAQWVGKDIFVKQLEILRRGAILAFFPEGNLGKREGELMPFYHGIGHFVLQADYPILPIGLSGTKELYWQKELIVTIGKPLRLNVHGLNHRQAIEAAVAQATRGLRATLPYYDEPVTEKKHLRFLTNLFG